MSVLHYTLGLSPYRSGGLTAWSEDLMAMQLKDGIDVLLLYPAEIKILRKKIDIKKASIQKKLPVFRLINPLPIPLIYAIDSMKHYIDYNKSVDFTNFFTSNGIDTIHLHTLMGLPIEFLQQAKKSGIKLIYTAHDTFGIWPEPQQNINDTKGDSIFHRGYIGNQQRLSYSVIIIMQSPLYRIFRSTKAMSFVKTLSSKIRGTLIKTHSPQKVSINDLQNRHQYEQMRGYYKKFFDLIDLIHYNSDFTKEIFETYSIFVPSVTLPVYHSYLPIRPIKPDATDDKVHNGKLRILYNGTREEYKGYNLLLEIFDELHSEGSYNFEVIMYGSGAPIRSYIKLVGSYSMSALKKVYTDIDVTIVPSLYCETFGMVVAESLSFDVPVILSKNVGAKSLISGRNYGYVFQARRDLKNYLKCILLNPNIIADQKKSILASNELIFDSGAVYVNVMKLYAKNVLA